MSTLFPLHRVDEILHPLFFCLFHVTSFSSLRGSLLRGPVCPLRAAVDMDGLLLKYASTNASSMAAKGPTGKEEEENGSRHDGGNQYETALVDRPASTSAAALTTKTHIPTGGESKKVQVAVTSP